MCVSDTVPQCVHVVFGLSFTFYPFKCPDTGKTQMFPHVRFKTQHPATSTNFVPRFSLATCGVCLFRSATRPNKAQRMMGMHLLIVAVVPAPSASALVQLKNDTFGPEDLLCETVTVHNDITFLIVVSQN